MSLYERWKTSRHARKDAKKSPTAQPTAGPANNGSGSAPESAAAPNSTPGVVVHTAPRTCAQRILDAAIGKIDEKHRAAIEELIQRPTGIDGILKTAQGELERLESACNSHKWETKVKGHTISLGGMAQGLSRMLGVIKPALDAAASIEPMYAGIPIALTRAILGVLDFNRDQMEVLLDGIDASIFMLHQLAFYCQVVERVSKDFPDPAKALEDALSNAYAHNLAFLAHGQHVAAAKGANRALKLLWTQGMLQDFKRDYAQDVQRLEMAAKQCDRGEFLQLLRANQDELVELRKLGRMLHLAEEQSVKLDLARLGQANGAAYDSVDAPKENTVESYCLPGTRESIINEIMAWCRQSQTKVFWLRGMAGTGKSTLIRTVARRLDSEKERLLGGSFFFRHDTADQRNAYLFVPTIVRQLVTKYPQLKTKVAEALENDLTLPGNPSQNQFDKLLKEPIMNIGLKKLVLIIDALDECEQNHAKIILHQLAILAEAIDLRVIVTSRPEERLLAFFENAHPETVRLEEWNEEEVDADIKLFLKSQFEEIVAAHASRSYSRLVNGWPGDTSTDQLVQLTRPLFIYAATLCRYIRQGVDPGRRLAELLEKGGGSQLTRMQGVYLPILENILREKDEDFMTDFKSVVGAIVLLQDPLSILALSRLLDRDPSSIECLLDELQSVLSVPPKSKIYMPVRALHKSFPDFLLNQKSRHAFLIDADLTHGTLLECCIRVMNEGLRKDICQVAAPGARREAFSRVKDFISSELRYACLYWTAHVTSRDFLQDDDMVHDFLRSHFLHWLEALSWLDGLPSAVEFITRLQSRVKPDLSEKLSAFLDDALRFTWKNAYIAARAPLQLYHSALVFTPERSIVRQTFSHEVPMLYSHLPKVPSCWGRERQTLEGHYGGVSLVEFSSNSKIIATADFDETLRIWDAMSGLERTKLQDWWNDGSGFIVSIDCLTFSADNMLLAAGFSNGQVRIWEISTAVELQSLQMPVQDNTKDSANFVAFSDDGSLVASASNHTGIVQVWETMTGLAQSVHGWQTKESRRASSINDGLKKGGRRLAFKGRVMIFAAHDPDNSLEIWQISFDTCSQKIEGPMHDMKGSSTTSLLVSKTSELEEGRIPKMPQYSPWN